MNCCRETTKMVVPPGNRRVLVPRRTVKVRRRGACPEPVEGTPEDARKDGHTRGRSRRFMKYPGWVKWKDHNELSYLQGK